jgi:hypothetical protein
LHQRRFFYFSPGAKFGEFRPTRRLQVICSLAVSSDVSKLAISTFDQKNDNHKKLASLSQHAHSAAAEGDLVRVREVEAEIDTEAARYWGLSNSEIGALASALRVFETSGNAKRKKTKAITADEGDS